MAYACFFSLFFVALADLDFDKSAFLTFSDLGATARAPLTVDALCCALPHTFVVSSHSIAALAQSGELGWIV